MWFQVIFLHVFDGFMQTLRFKANLLTLIVPVQKLLSV